MSLASAAKEISATNHTAKTERRIAMFKFENDKCYPMARVLE